ncbi:MAG: hypothetical protein KGH93_00110 [Patescibacteria group bacterium]|nr:hypothetical protein [Patescibacteria group bacterium]
MNDKQKELLEQMIADVAVRRRTVEESHQWFFLFYFGHYMQYHTAPFQVDMFRLTEDNTVKNALIIAFRGSAKSTIFTLSFPIWAILGRQQIKHVLILSSTRQKAQVLLQNIKSELERNHMLRADLGPFKEETNEWNTTSLYIQKYDAKITCGSVEQSIRGIRFKEHRPELIILDDIEDMESVKTKEGRDKIEGWLSGEVIPAGDISTRLFFVGNLLHNDSVAKRLEQRIAEGRMDGECLKVAILDSDGQPAWPGKYPDQDAIDAEHKKQTSETAWRREFMLEIIPEDDQIVREEYIHYYDELPPMDRSSSYRFAVTGVDPAISEKDSADYTAMVSAQVFGYGKDRVIYVLPNPVNERLDVTSAVRWISIISRSLGNGVPTKVWIEQVGYQKALVDFCKEQDLPAEGVSIAGHDKHSRVVSATPLMQSGRILFPKHGCEHLITQMLGFGIEKHDDLVDAFTLIVLNLLKDDGSNGTYVVPSMKPGAEKKDQSELERLTDQLTMAQSEWHRGNNSRELKNKIEVLWRILSRVRSQSDAAIQKERRRFNNEMGRAKW